LVDILKKSLEDLNMFRKSFLAIFIVLALVTMSCSFTVNLPVTKVQTGPTRTENIDIPNPDGSDANLTLAFAAGELNLTPGGSSALVSGTAVYNVDELKPVISGGGADVRLQTGQNDVKFNGIPSFGNNFKNQWDLVLGENPMDLTVMAGAYKGNMELGGLSLKSLHVTDGAAQVELKFSQPNQVEMSLLHYETGASDVSLSGLANANADSIEFRSGAGNYTLDFGGDLLRDTRMDVRSGISKVTIYVPVNSNATVVFNGGLSSVNTTGNWQKSSQTYSYSGGGANLDINVEMGAGSVDLVVR
jgi:N-terminal domain of toast_rack, DUF2154